jgi:ribosome recycling factor
MVENIFTQFKEALEKAMARFQEYKASIRTSRPTPALIENIPVECYGTRMLLKEIATITVQPPNVLLVQPWDKGNLQAIERALLKSEAGGMVAVDSDLVRFVLPPLTAERRNELVRLLNKKAEETRIAFRLARDEARKAIIQLASDKKISEDEKFRLEKQLQEMFDTLQTKLNNMVAEYEKEIMTV